MAGAEYSIWLSSPGNVRLAVIADFVSLAYKRMVNEAGWMTLVLPASFNRDLLKRDTRLEIWRRIEGLEYLETNTQWLVRKVTLDHDNQLLLVAAGSGLDLVRRRVIAYDAGAATSTKNAVADDMIVEFVKENLGASATDTDRDWSSKITIFTSPGNGPSVHKAASRRNLLTTIQEIAQDAASQGTPTFFDVEYNVASKLFEFKTFTQQRGVDLSVGSGLVTLSPDFGTLAEVVREDDYTEELTFVYAAGQGQGGDRNIQTASDTTRIDASPFGRIEAIVDARNTNDNDKLTAEAEAAVRGGRPRRVQTGRIVNRAGATYGVNWNWGDKVKVEIEGEVNTARIDVVEVNVSRAGDEVVRAGIRVED